MTPGITLKEVGLSQDFRDGLKDYYSAIHIDGLYPDHRWRQWTEDKGIIAYTAQRDENTIGWLVYNPLHSTIEEILPKETGGKGFIATAMIDALIARESLVAAEVLKADKAKIETLIAYGFRPTRSFCLGGFDFVKLDLSTAEFLRKVRGWRPSEAYGKTELVAVEKVPPAGTHDEIKSSLL